MKTFNKGKFMPLSLLLTLSLVGTMATPIIAMAAGQPKVNLGTTSTFAVLAGSKITNTGTTTINGSAGGNVDGNVGGDVGLFPGTVFTGRASSKISGAVHQNDAVAIKAKDDLVTAYNDAAGRKPVTTIPSELGGRTLTPGTYDSVDGTFNITGKLTLDAKGDPNGVFVFKTASTLITLSGSDVKLINSARFCRTFWQVGSSATLGTNSHFVGHILAMQSITAANGATVQGQLLARNGAVSLNTNTITNGFCATKSVAPPAKNGATKAVSPTIKRNVTKAVAPTVKSGDTKVVSHTLKGGVLPKTSTPLYTLLLMGTILTIVGALGWRKRKSYE